MQPSASTSHIADSSSPDGDQRRAPVLQGARRALAPGAVRDRFDQWLAGSADGPVVRFAHTLRFLDTDDGAIVSLARRFEQGQREAFAAAEQAIREDDTFAAGFTETDEMVCRERDEANAHGTLVGHLACTVSGGIVGLVAGVLIGLAF